MPAIADRLKNVSISASAAMTQRARDLAEQGINVISLSAGEPDFATPSNAVNAAHAAALAGDTKYPSMDGTPALKAAISRKFKRDNNLDYDPSQIIVSGGGKQVIFNAMLATCNPGDEVVIPTPSWISYADIVKFAGGTPVPVACPQQNGFKLRAEDLEAAITPRTKWLFLNFPNNPTGAACSREDMKAIAEVMLRHPHVWIMTDDIYEHLIYDDFEFCTIAEVEPRLYDRVLTMNGASKAYAMTGWRLGFCGGPKDLISAISNVNGQNGGGTSTVVQAAAVAVLDGPQDLLKERASIYKQRRDFVLSELAKINGLRCHKPEGAFYIFPNMSGLIGKRSKAGHKIETDTDFVMALVNEHHVATVQGAAYGMSPFFRISYATSMEKLTEACARISQFCSELR
ncbi:MULTISPECIES: pyridoxal phosphate-dependent aminotransferase [Agrobacterium]|uniref:Aminotransferase n=1 Tax=Agrobacterium rosae TaxID=1972867 RepID=A0A1R3TWB1_9HYPH|nr:MULTISPECIES: pyridoxal phosphate-dependent aminotransferase [Agrobacterium]MBN7806438.1 pyridoxal phosphate-dependent aminotransferase [Agrobacterium rosae]MBN7806619.1 pyridoxal phosphate-dependent aminotransferase [Agrobacterium rosae]MDX8304949.1 pyridoxal phosphate-dependent aminotransferase [Agrobacterium rosae]POO52669.1 pyridoxal phosphate-dependent aminotransferase [Agrobacterium rosae]SCX21875.1 Aspartate aminotransferase [Agrobacterium sp. DSM 25558]